MFEIPKGARDEWPGEEGIRGFRKAMSEDDNGK